MRIDWQQDRRDAGLAQRIVAVNKLHRFMCASLSPYNYATLNNGKAHVPVVCISLC
jgi:hypothetical protein